MAAVKMPTNDRVNIGLSGIRFQSIPFDAVLTGSHRPQHGPISA